MIKSVITAKLELCGSVKIEFPIDITDHKAREILDGIADVMTDKHTSGKITRTEKDEFNLARIAKGDLDQQEIPLPIVTDCEVVERPALPAPEHVLEHIAETGGDND